MKLAIVGLIALGVLAAACAAVLTATLTSRGDANASNTAEEQVEVILALHNLEPMTVIDSTLFTTKKVPKSQAPEGALLSTMQVVGKILTERMVANQAFTRNCFAREGRGVYLAAAVPPGKRAMSITLTDWSGMAGLLYPGGMVDVLVSFKTLDGVRRDDEMKTTTLLQGLMVLAIGSQSVADDEFKDKNPGAMAATGQTNYRMVTLLVEPKQAEILQLAMQSGSISLSLRNPRDGEQQVRRLTRASEIVPGGGFAGAVIAAPTDPFDNEPPAEPLPVVEALDTPAPRGPSGWQTLIIRGKTTETRTFPMPADHVGNQTSTSDPDPQPQPEAVGGGVGG